MRSPMANLHIAPTDLSETINGISNFVSEKWKMAQLLTQSNEIAPFF